MEIQQSKVYNAAMWHGLYFSVFLIIRFFIMVNTDNNLILNAIVMGLTISIPVVAYYLGKNFKQKHEEELTYRNFYSHGFFMFFFASLILAAVEYVYYGFINPDFIQNQYNTLLENLEIIKQTMPDASQIEEMVNNSPIPTASQMAMQNIWMYSFAGIIISLINAYILNKKH
ncbi:MAG: DUF4199 domain-containing protein [Paludibacteraceae bacterium]|nr:DUF4199 domain-containing protein [Paludibacteraceae bacterium]MBR6685911.1 DUF4199 domain-containing protein [Paludibacteraceae bacterium]